MSAETLRRAAKLLRERAEAVPPAPWEVTNPNEGTEYLPLWEVTNDEFNNPTDGDSPGLGVVIDTGGREEADYIALMHPPVALALAEWLEAAAVALDANYGAEADLLAEIDDDQTAQHAVIVARAVLRGES